MKRVKCHARKICHCNGTPQCHASKPVTEEQMMYLWYEQAQLHDQQFLSCPHEGCTFRLADRTLPGNFDRKETNSRILLHYNVVHAD